jgi:peptidoglycan hydrolase-like protein with peptidoglycan-binding domain
MWTSLKTSTSLPTSLDIYAIDVNTILSGQYAVRVSVLENDGDTAVDYSYIDTVPPPPPITVIYPNDGTEVWKQGEAKTILWSGGKSSWYVFVYVLDENKNFIYSPQSGFLNNGSAVVAMPFNDTYGNPIKDGKYYIRIACSFFDCPSGNSDDSDRPFWVGVKPLPSPTASYSFSEGSGNTTKDSSLYMRSGVISGASWTTAGKYGNGLSFDGSDYVKIPSLLGSPKNVTLTGWANVTGADTYGSTIISLGDHIVLMADMRKNKVSGADGYFYDGVGWPQTDSGALYIGTGWHHFAYVFDYDAHAQRVYVDGELKATTSFIKPIVYTSKGKDTFIGKHGNGSSAYNFKGTIDEVRVYSEALVSDQIKKDMVTAPFALISPNNGEKWQLGDTHSVLWTPYDPMAGINPASQVSAYLEKLVNGTYVRFGKIVECGKASIHWDGSLDTCGVGGKLAEPGDYYIYIINDQTGQADRSDKPVTIVARGSLTADLKINGKDDPVINIPPGGGMYTATWTSNAEKCSLYNDTLSYNNPDQYKDNLPPSGTLSVKLLPNMDWYSRSVSIYCSAKTPVEGSAWDKIEVPPLPTFVTVGSPNGGEELDGMTKQTISWSSSSALSKISIALYKNDASNGWIVTDFPVSGLTGSYSWLPSNITPEIGNNIFKIYILGYKFDGGTVEDKSDSPFSIVSSEDVTPPKISITAPVGSLTYSAGQTVKVSATASDANGIARVEFIDSGALKFTATSTPYEYSMPITSATGLGQHAWFATAYDSSNNYTMAGPRYFTVAALGLGNGKILGRVWEDVNANGVIDTGEKYIIEPGATCTGSNSIAVSGITVNGSGSQNFSKASSLCYPGTPPYPYYDTDFILPPGSYNLTLAVPTGWEVTTDQKNGKTVQVTAGQPIGERFGVRRISGSVLGASTEQMSSDDVLSIALTNTLNQLSDILSGASLSDNEGGRVLGVTAGETLVCPSLTRYLYEGRTDANTYGQVTPLQRFLQQDPRLYGAPVSGDGTQGFYRGGDTPGVFGSQTKEAVKRFQHYYAISQSGTVGPITRNKIKEICPPAKIISPNGNKVFQRGTTQTIQWRSNTERSYLVLKSVRSNYTPWRISRVNSGTGSYEWSIPADMPEGNYKIQISGFEDDMTFDESDTTFNIVAPDDETPPTVSITTPQPGSTYKEGQTIQVRATASDPSRILRVEFAVDGGTKSIDTAAPFEYSMPATLGRHAWFATAYDRLGNTTTAGPVYFTVEAGPSVTVAVVEDAIPTVTNATINSSSVTANGSTQYTITVTATDPNGGADIGSEYVTINNTGANAGVYRGYLMWFSPGSPWAGSFRQAPITCAGGEKAGLYDGADLYGSSYINLISCSTSVLGNTRTTSFIVTFDPKFTTPIANNSISGFAFDRAFLDSGWQQFGTFGLTAPPVVNSSTNGKIAGRVWEDLNANGVIDTGEKYIIEPGATCAGSNSIVVSGITVNGSGPQNFSKASSLCYPDTTPYPYYDTDFILPPGSYNLSISLPKGWEVTTDQKNGKTVQVTAGQPIGERFGVREITGSVLGAATEETLVCPVLTQYLIQGKTDVNSNGQVTVLQQFLQQNPQLYGATVSGDGTQGFYRGGDTLGTFGPQTKEAVKRFQRYYSITAYGTVGPITRSKIKELCPPVKIISPNGNEVLQRGTTQTIQWHLNTSNSNLVLKAVRSYYAPRLIESVSADAESYTWSIPADMPEGNYKIRIYRDNVLFDESDNTFRIVSVIPQAPAITLLDPASSITRPRISIIGTGLRGYNNVLVTNASGAQESIRAYSSNATTLNFYFPSTLTTPGEYTISVRNDNGTSNNLIFTLVPEVLDSIVIAAPTQGVVAKKGEAYTIRWTTQNSNRVTIYNISRASIRLKKGTSIVDMITLNAPSVGGGTYTWTPSQQLVEGADYAIRIDAIGSPVFAESPIFMVASGATTPSITVGDPNTADVSLVKGQKYYDITWSSQNVSNVRIKLKRGTIVLATIASLSSQNGLNTYRWNDPTASRSIGIDYRIYVEDTAIGSSASDESDAPFSIVLPDDTTPPTISIMGPTSGQNIVRGETLIFSADVTDASGVYQVVMSGGDQLVPQRTFTSPPFRMEVPIPASTGLGQHCLFVSAMDASPNINRASSVSRCFNVVAGPSMIVADDTIPPTIPNPVLVFVSKTDFPMSGTTYTNYKLSVTNWSLFPSSLFVPSTALPLCGSPSMRTRVNIYNGVTGAYLYGYCALTSPQSLANLYVNVLKNDASPQTIYVTIDDRQTNTVYRSNTVSVGGSVLGASSGYDTSARDIDLQLLSNVLINLRSVLEDILQNMQ